jgi:spore coat polysaccharide biosynthesis predicted glycosyltransferase SpsG
MGVLLNLTILAEFNILVKRSKEKPQLKLTILIGHSSINAPELKNIASQFKTLSLPGPVTNMTQFLWEHDAAVCAGGATLH